MGREFRATAALMFWLLAALLKPGIASGQQAGSLASATNDFKMADLASLTNDLKISLWDTTVNLRGMFGYKDNVGLANTNRVGAPFWDSGADVMVIRLPSGPWTFSFFATADDTRYFGDEFGQSEQLIIAAAQASRSLPDNWSAGAGLNYFFQNQILDVTATQTNQFAITQVRGNNFMGRVFVRKEYQGLWMQLDLNGGRGLMAAPLDDFWQFGPRFSVGYRYGHGSEVSADYQWTDQIFATRQQVSAAGYSLPGTLLRFYSQTAELNWHQVWDGSNYWHSFVTAGYDLNQDNGSGYFNYSQYRLSGKIEYRGRRWTLSAFARGGYFGYPVQTVSTESSELRGKLWLTTGVHAERILSPHFKIYADCVYDRSRSNDYTDDYFDDTFSLGFNWQIW